MKKCPYCGEEIRDEAIKCRFCGEFLEEEKTPSAERPSKLVEEPKKETKEVKPAGTNLIGVFILFLFLSLVFSFIFLSIQSERSFPYLSIIAIIAGIVGIVISTKIFRNKRRISIKLMAFSIPFFLLGVLFLNTGYSNYKRHLKQEKQAKLELLKRKQERQRIIQYNREHKEEHYLKGLELLKERKYQEAKEMFKKVISVDENYKDVKPRIQNIDDILIKIKKEKEITTAQEQINEAGKLLKSDKCYDIQKAITKCNQALKVLPDSKAAKRYLLEAKLNYLLCYEGNNKIKMIAKIRSYCPLKLNVGIKNVSNEVRHANPGYFTLVTVSGRSYSVSTDTYGLSYYFDAVDLQPGTETSGAIIFDTCDKPKELVYSEMLGSTISRKFPFE